MLEMIFVRHHDESEGKGLEQAGTTVVERK